VESVQIRDDAAVFLGFFLVKGRNLSHVLLLRRNPDLGYPSPIKPFLCVCACFCLIRAAFHSSLGFIGLALGSSGLFLRLTSGRSQAIQVRFLRDLTCMLARRLRPASSGRGVAQPAGRHTVLAHLPDVLASNVREDYFDNNERRRRQ
jgi:hypothetical protein